MAASGRAVLLISHDADAVLAVADRIVVLHHGRVTVDRPAPGLTRLDVLGWMASGGDHALGGLPDA